LGTCPIFKAWGATLFYYFSLLDTCPFFEGVAVGGLARALDNPCSYMAEFVAQSLAEIQKEDFFIFYL
jgi:hypothetical protein